MKLSALGLAVLLLSVPILGQRTRDAANQPSTAPVTFDCAAGSAKCPELRIEGVSAAVGPNGDPSPFRGFADPTLRADPRGRRLWLAYAWPKVREADEQTGPGRRRFGLRRRGRGRGANVVPGVDVLLAHSDDGGSTWRSDGSLWPSQPDTDRGGNGASGYTNYEVPNLLPVETGGRVEWYGARLDYFLPGNAGFAARPSGSFRVAIGRADSPIGLRDAPMQILGSAGTAKGWGVDVYLSSLSPELARCGLWNEPALHANGDVLYLALRCLSFNGKIPNVAASDIVVFSTRPTGDVKRWQWTYVGKLAGSEEARELGGRGLTQIDFARGRDGQLLLVATPDEWRGLEFNHFGCRVVEVQSIDPPRLARDAEGHLKVRASITASDLQPFGPGACAYEPQSSTGILIVRRHRERGLMTASIHVTGVRP